MLKYVVIALLSIAVVGGLVYKAMSPNDYQDPRVRSSK